MFRGLVDNVLSGIKACFKFILNFEHPFERKKMFIQKGSSKLSATLLALILGASVFMAGQVWAGKYVKDPSTGKVVTAPEYGGTITIRIKSMPENTDQMALGRWAAEYLNGVLEKPAIGNWGISRDQCEGLTLSWAPPQCLTGALAESWEMPDDKTVIFHIRQGVHWHDKPPMNGREFTADDMAFNFHRITGTGSGFTEPSGHTTHLNAIPLKFESIQATDRYTVVFKLKEPNVNTLHAIVDDETAYIYPPEVIQKYGDATNWRNLVGTGPFMLTQVVTGSSITWDKNPNYWGTDEKYPENRLPYIDKLRALMMPETATYLAALRTAKVDGGDRLNTIDQLESLQKTSPQLVFWPIYVRSNQTFGLNVQYKPFSDIRVRRAMQMALDLEAINSRYYKGQAKIIPWGQIRYPGYSYLYEEWSDEVKKAYNYDPEGAKKLLAEAGYPNGFKAALMHYEAYDVNFSQLAAGFWREIGVEVDVQVTTRADFGPKRAERNYEMSTSESAISGVGAQGRFYYKTPWNTSGTNDPKYNAMYEASSSAKNQDELKRMVREMEKYGIERHWQIWGGMAPQFFVFWPWIKGFNGELALGSGQYKAYYSRLWIDQELKDKIIP